MSPAGSPDRGIAAAAVPAAVAVIVPTRGRPAALRRCLEGLGRMHPPEGGFEVIVVSDGRQPEVDAAVAEIGATVSLRVLHQEQAGPAEARNHGASRARTARLAFVDDDCLPDRGWLRALCARLDADPDALVGGRVVNGAGSRSAAAAHLVLEVVAESFERDRPGQMFFPTMNLALSRETFEALGGFDASFPLAAAEDRDLCERAHTAGHPLVRAPEAVVVHEHDLTVRRLWRQQRAYGRGAVHLARAKRRRGEALPVPVVRLYARLSVAAVAGRSPGDAARSLGLVGLTQVAYASGIVAECIASLGRAGGRGGQPA